MKNKNKRSLEPEFKKIFSILMNGNLVDYKEAKKELERLWRNNTKAFKKSASVVLEYIAQFDKIKNPENKAAFASGLGLFFLVLADEHFETLKDFVLKVIQYPHGHVREAIRKTADWLYISLSSRIDPSLFPNKELTIQQKSEQINAKKQYLDYINEIESLINQYNINNDDSAEYINEMKPSVNKSLQMLWSRLTDTPCYQRLLEERTPPEILKKRREIEKELEELLKQTESDFCLDDIKEIIYNEEDQDDLVQVMAMFDRGRPEEMGTVLEAINDAWNYFPHRCLDDLCPMEKILEYQQNKNKS